MGEEVQHYRTLPSLREYLLIAQDAYHIDHFIRDADSGWRLTEGDGPAASLHLPSIGCDLVLADVYEKVAPGG